jgi:hypothetical protein
MYSYFGYLRQKVAGNPSKFLTRFTSTPEENGGIEWNRMDFEAKRPLSAKEIDIVIEAKADLKSAITQEKAFYASQNGTLHTAERDPLEDEFEDRPRLNGRR